MTVYLKYFSTCYIFSVEFLKIPPINLVRSLISEDGGEPVQEGEEDEEEIKKKERTEKQNEKEFEVEGDILKPEFMATKSMVDYAPAEISAVEQYEVKNFFFNFDEIFS